MDKLLRRLFRRSAILVLGCAFAGSAQADWLLIQRITDANGQARSAYTWVGADRLRYDDGRMTLIANARTGELSVYDHLSRTVEQRALAKPALPTTTPFRPEKLTQFRQWPVSHYLFRKQTLHLEVATTEQVPPDLESQYKRLMNAIAAGFGAYINNTVAHTCGLGRKNFIFSHNPQCKGIDQNISVIGWIKSGLSTNSRDPNTVSVTANAFNNTRN